MISRQRGRRPGRLLFAWVGLLIVISVAHQTAAAPPESLSLSLRVVEEESGHPLEGVAVSRRAGRETRMALTDAQGRCSLDVPVQTSSFFEISARKEGFVPVAVDWSGQDGEKVPIPGEYTLALAKGTAIGGLIRDESGNPIAGASVFILVPSDEPSEPGKPRVRLRDFEAKTDAEGHWRCDVVPAKLNDVKFRLSHRGFVGDTTYGATPRPSLEKLRDQSGVMVLKKGLTVRGRVLANNGKPIAGAMVAQGDQLWGARRPEATTDDAGGFQFANCRPGEMVLTVQAKGYSPDLKKISVAPSLPEVEFALEPAHRISGRVVDPQGEPVAGVAVIADAWRGYRSLRYNAETDQNGRFTWADAPGDEVQIDLFKPGYMTAPDRVVKASEDDLRITLLKALKIQGAVVDAETGQPVEDFTVTPGMDSGMGRDPSWQRRSARRGSSGHNVIVFNTPWAGHLIRIEADGYLPAVSRSFQDQEGEVTFDVKLKKGKGLSGTVVDDCGTSVADASVCLITPSSRMRLTNARPPGRRDSAVVETDRQGRFRFPAQEGRFALAVLHDRGFALRTDAQFAASRDVTLAPWGSVEGTIRVGARAAAGESVRLTIDQENRGDELRPYFDYQATADAQGNYRFDRVPPGKVFVHRETKLSEWSTGYSHTVVAEVKPGRTTRADVGGTGRPVVGRVVASEGTPVDWSLGILSLTPAPLKLDVPKDLTPAQKAKWCQERSKTPEGRAAQERAQRQYVVKVEVDGSFRVEDVPAENYILNITVQEPTSVNRLGISGEQLGSVEHKLSVPEIPGGRSDDPLDVGTLELTLDKHVKPGDVAPAFSVPSLDGQTIKLEEFRGKFVLLDFWATWCGPCRAETPHLKAAYEAFRNDDRFVMIGLSLDQDQEDPRKYVEQNALAWRQGFLGDFSEAKLPTEYGVRGIPSTWLIGPDGKVIAKDLRGDALNNAVAKALSEAK